MTNHDILKKLRVALQLCNDQIQEIIGLTGLEISLTELGAFFRAEDHRNYRPCGDQVLRNFLDGLIISMRGSRGESASSVEAASAAQGEGAELEPGPAQIGSEKRGNLQPGGQKDARTSAPPYSSKDTQRDTQQTAPPSTAATRPSRAQAAETSAGSPPRVSPPAPPRRPV